MRLTIAYCKAAYPERWKDAAFERIWHSYYRRVRYFIRVSFDSREADDRAQEVMAKVFEKLDSYDGRHAFSTWLYTLARNHCIDQARKKRLTLSELPDSVRALADTEHEVITRDEDKEVASALAELPADEQGIAFLAFGERAPYKRIGEIYGMPLYTVKNRVHAIRSKLKERLMRTYEA